MNSARLEAFRSRPLLYLVAGCPKEMAWKDFEDRLERALQGGVGVLQMREKGLSRVEARDFGARYRDLTRRFGIPFVVNDDPELARDLGAEGLHLGQDDLRPIEARRIVGPEMVIGWSTHDDEQVRQASGDREVDLIGIGPVAETDTKDAGPARGLDLAWRAAALFRKGPVFPIGGIDVARARRLARGGLDRAAVASAVLSADDPKVAAADLLEALASARA